MKYKILLTSTAICAVGLSAVAAVPCEWSATPQRPAPAQFDRFHGESLDFRCTFTGFGALPFDGASDVRLWYQTNGMGAVWWSLPATVSNNVLSTTFTPDRDPGAERLAVFFGAPSNAYAAAQVHFRHSPGFTPNALPPPSILDWVVKLADATNVIFEALGRVETNTYTKAETEAKIVEFAPVGITTNDVCGIVTNAIPVEYGDWDYTWADPANQDRYNVGIVDYSDGEWMAFYKLKGGMSYSHTAIGHAPEDAVRIEFYSTTVEPELLFVATRRVLSSRNALGLARTADLAPAISNTVTKAFVEDLGIESGIQEETDPNWAAEKGEYAKTGTVAQVSSSVGELWSYVYGERVWIVVTNHMRTIAGVAPSFQLWEVRDGITNCVYSSAEEIDTRTNDKIETCKSSMSNMVEALRAEMPAKSWSRYQSATGAENPQPDKITIISTPAIQMTGGGEWYEYISTGGSSIWVLRSNGLVKFGGNTNGFFRVEDDEGRAQFEVINTAEVTVDAIAETTGFDADDNFMVTYDWTNSVPPTLYAARDIADPSIGEVNGEIDALGISVSWERGEGPDGMWTATVTQDERAPRLFVHAKVVQTGVRAVVNTAPARLDGGLIIGTTRYRLVPFSSGGKTYLTLEAVAQ